MPCPDICFGRYRSDTLFGAEAPAVVDKHSTTSRAYFTEHQRYVERATGRDTKLFRALQMTSGTTSVRFRGKNSGSEG